MRKSSRFFPAIHAGALPRPVQVAPLFSSRYFWATFLTVGFHGKTCWAVNPNSVTSSCICLSASSDASFRASEIAASNCARCAKRSFSVVVIALSFSAGSRLRLDYPGTGVTGRHSMTTLRPRRPGDSSEWMCGRKNPESLKHSPLGRTFQKLSTAHFRCHRACTDKCFRVGLSCAIERPRNELTACTRTTCPTLSRSKRRIFCRHTPILTQS